MCLALGRVDVGIAWDVLEALGQAGIGCEIMNTAKKKVTLMKRNGCCYYNCLTPFLGEGQKRRVTG